MLISDFSYRWWIFCDDLKSEAHLKSVRKVSNQHQKMKTSTKIRKSENQHQNQSKTAKSSLNFSKAKIYHHLKIFLFVKKNNTISFFGFLTFFVRMEITVFVYKTKNCLIYGLSIMFVVQN